MTESPRVAMRVARRPRIAKASASALDSVVKAARHDDRVEKRRNLMQLIDQDPSGDLLEVALSAIKLKSTGGSLEKRLARGCRYVSKTPDYIVKGFLAKFSSIDEAVFENLPLADLRQLWSFALQVSSDFKIPMLQMPVKEYETWASERYIEMGKLLNGHENLLPEPDWCFGIGCFSLFLEPEVFDEDGEVDSDTKIGKLKCNLNAKMCELPAHFSIAVGDVPDLWAIVDNHDPSLAALMNVTTGTKQNCQMLFQVVSARLLVQLAISGRLLVQLAISARLLVQRWLSVRGCWCSAGFQCEAVGAAEAVQLAISARLLVATGAISAVGYWSYQCEAAGGYWWLLEWVTEDAV